MGNAFRETEEHTRRDRMGLGRNQFVQDQTKDLNAVWEGIVLAAKQTR